MGEAITLIKLSTEIVQLARFRLTRVRNRGGSSDKK